MTAEPHDIRLKRLKMRASHRGMREMDLILSAWADRHLAAADGATLDLFETLLEEPDQDIYAWISGQAAAPRQFADLTAQLATAIQPPR